MDGDIGHSLKWSALSALLVRALSAARSITIARLLGPKSLGQFAAAIAFVALASLVTEFGLQSFLIHRGTRSRSDAAVVGQLALVIGGISAVGLMLAARPIADFYGDGTIAGLVVAMTASVLLTAFTVVPSALLRADLRFDIVGRAAVIAELVALAVGVGAALRGAGVWSLVAAALISQVVSLAVLLLARPSHEPTPSREQRAQTRAAALRFGATVVGGSTVWAVALHGDNVVIGRVLGTAALGLYAFSYNYGVLPAGFVASAISDVALASFSRHGTDPLRATLFVRFTQVTATLACPLVATSLVTAPAAIRLVLGEAWVGATRPLQVLLVVGLIRSLVPTEALLRSKGMVSLELKVGLVAAPTTLAAAYAGSRIGLTAAALFVGVALSAAGVFTTWIAVRSVGLALREIAAAIAPSLVLSALVCAAPLGLIELVGIAPDAAMVALFAPLALVAAALATRRFLPQQWSALSDIAAARRLAASEEPLR